jgi:hypothetical protein
MRIVQTSQGMTVAEAAEDGPTVVTVARDYQTGPENDPDANRYGWNCRLHNKYEGAPAVDWYLPIGTPAVSTMRGQAELYVITPLNGFVYYGVDPRLYLGLPSPSLPLYPFPGPGGGMGIFISVLNGELRAEYGHLDLTRTLQNVPDSASSPYSPLTTSPVSTGPSAQTTGQWSHAGRSKEATPWASLATPAIQMYRISIIR